MQIMVYKLSLSWPKFFLKMIQNLVVEHLMCYKYNNLLIIYLKFIVTVISLSSGHANILITLGILFCSVLCVTCI